MIRFIKQTFVPTDSDEQIVSLSYILDLVIRDSKYKIHKIVMNVERFMQNPGTQGHGVILWWGTMLINICTIYFGCNLLIACGICNS